MKLLRLIPFFFALTLTWQVLICSVPAQAAISRPTGCQAAAANCTPSNATTGDDLLIVGRRLGSATVPTNCTGCTSITTGTVGSSTTEIAYRVACKVVPAGAATAVTMSNAADITVTILRGAYITGTRSCGAFGTPTKTGTTATTTYNYGAATATDDGGAATSWFLGIIMLSATSSGGLNAPTNMTQELITSDNFMAQQDTNGTFSGNWPSTNVTGGSSVNYAAVVIEANAAPVVTACSGTCAGMVDDSSYGTNDTDDVASATYTFSLANAALSGNAISCGVTYDGTVSGGNPTPSFTMTDNSGGNTWHNAVFASDGTRATGLVYALNVAAGTVNLTATLGATASDFSAHCTQFYNVATSSAVDGTPTVTTNLTGPILSGGSITTTQANDLVFVYVPESGGYCCTTVVTGFSPGPGFNLLTVAPQLVNSAEFLNWGGSGAITPTIYVGNTSNTFAVASIAFKGASAGTAPSGMWLYCHGVNKMTGSVASVPVQVPCPIPSGSPNLIVVDTHSKSTDFTLSGVTDSPDGNTYTEVTTTGYPQLYYAQNAAFTNSNSRYMLLANNHASTTVVEWYVFAGADTSAYDGNTTNSGTQVADGGATCTNSSNVNSSVTLTPTTNRKGYVLIAESNGTGPECATSTTGGVFDSFWYSGETDGNSSGYTASGYGHLPYTSNAAQTYTFNWANGAISVWNNLAVAFKAPATATAIAPPLWVIQP